MAQKVLIIVGPTASGKSALGVELARRYGGEIVSADSRQVYRGLNIGTGKITKKEMRGIPHHMLDIASPKKAFSASDYAEKARAAIADIGGRSKLPIIVGGTGFYIDAVVGRIELPEVPPNKVLRKRLASKSTAQLYTMLKKADPMRAKAMDTPSERNNKVRLIRAIEVARSRGSTKPRPRGPRGYDVRWIGIVPNDEELKTRIHKRLRERHKKGMVNEAKRLHAAGLSYKRMNELGLEYRSLARLLQKKISGSDLDTELQSDIWRYARKQIGYWKRNKDIRWFDPKSKKIESFVRSWLKK